MAQLITSMILKIFNPLITCPVIFLPIYKWFYPSTSGSTHLQVVLPIYKWFYPSTSGSTLLQVVLPIYKWFYPSTSGSTHLQVVLPIYKWFYPSTSGSTHLQVVPPVQRTGGWVSAYSYEQYTPKRRKVRVFRDVAFLQLSFASFLSCLHLAVSQTR